jgi:hypothetical protein
MNLIHVAITGYSKAVKVCAIAPTLGVGNLCRMNQAHIHKGITVVHSELGFSHCLGNNIIYAAGIC